MTRLLPETVLVTGAARRIGRAIALDLARRGMNVVIHHHTSEREARALQQEIVSMGRSAWTLAADLQDPTATKNLLARAREQAGPIGALVHSASVFSPSRLMEFSWSTLEQNLRIHAWAPLVLSRDFAAGAPGGSIINLLDTRICEYDREHAAYHLSKRMLFSLTRMLALELAPTFRVNAVAPGLILPPPGQTASFLEQERHKNPLHQVGEVQDVARAVVFLLESRFVTGQVLFVDGGRHLVGATYD